MKKSYTTTQLSQIEYFVSSYDRIKGIISTDEVKDPTDEHMLPPPGSRKRRSVTIFPITSPATTPWECGIIMVDHQEGVTEEKNTSLNESTDSAANESMTIVQLMSFNIDKLHEKAKDIIDLLNENKLATETMYMTLDELTRQAKQCASQSFEEQQLIIIANAFAALEDFIKTHKKMLEEHAPHSERRSSLLNDSLDISFDLTHYRKLGEAYIHEGTPPLTSANVSFDSTHYSKIGAAYVYNGPELNASLDSSYSRLGKALIYQGSPYNSDEEISSIEGEPLVINANELEDFNDATPRVSSHSLFLRPVEVENKKPSTPEPTVKKFPCCTIL